MRLIKDFHRGPLSSWLAGQNSCWSARKSRQVVFVIRVDTQSLEGQVEEIAVPADPDRGQGKDTDKADPVPASRNDIDEESHDDEAESQEKQIGKVLFHNYKISPGIEDASGYRAILPACREFPGVRGDLGPLFF